MDRRAEHTHSSMYARTCTHPHFHSTSFHSSILLSLCTVRLHLDRQRNWTPQKENTKQGNCFLLENDKGVTGEQGEKNEGEKKKKLN